MLRCNLNIRMLTQMILTTAPLSVQKRKPANKSITCFLLRSLELLSLLYYIICTYTIYTVAYMIYACIIHILLYGKGALALWVALGFRAKEGVGWAEWMDTPQTGLTFTTIPWQKPPLLPLKIGEQLWCKRKNNTVIVWSKYSPLPWPHHPLF